MHNNLMAFMVIGQR